ncbi:hypothetical protein MXB_3932, partial [Myxobolus squamalis]
PFKLTLSLSKSSINVVEVSLVFGNDHLLHAPLVSSRDCLNFDEIDKLQTISDEFRILPLKRFKSTSNDVLKLELIVSDKTSRLIKLILWNVEYIRVGIKFIPNVTTLMIFFFKSDLFESKSLLRIPIKQYGPMEKLGLCTVNDICKETLSSFTGKCDIYLTSCNLVLFESHCTNPICDSFDSQQSLTYTEYNFHASISDYTGTIDGCLISSQEVQKIINITPEKFIGLTEEEKLIIKESLMFEQFCAIFTVFRYK